ncbi:hypothetical protein [Trinickia dinghuensis]|uniref:Uncharacterized protein n=1 Tax=Trinickia dinghuensis TaxID=2291023 RepID=A0A3D8K3C0_9BURK|nr:hypothetical protein [Trinickia dinghuensis]RDU99375.1 hypothetical protein DWV00_09745 [Trinickia dinghuensis]
MTNSDRSTDTFSLNLAVRAAAGELRIISIWQALGRYGAKAKRTRVHRDGKKRIDELIVTFESIAPAELSPIVAQLNAEPWVAGVVTTSPREVDRQSLKLLAKPELT